MSQLTANTLMPLFSALPEEEQHAFAEKIQQLLEQRSAPRSKKKKRSVLDKVADQLGEEWRPENREMLISKIMNES